MIAKKNGIPYQTEECTAKGDCKGYCPKCDEELRGLNKAIAEKESKGKKKKMPKEFLKELVADCVDLTKLDTLAKMKEEQKKLQEKIQELRRKMSQNEVSNQSDCENLEYFYRMFTHRLEELSEKISVQAELEMSDEMREKIREKQEELWKLNQEAESVKDRLRNVLTLMEKLQLLPQDDQEAQVNLKALQKERIRLNAVYESVRTSYTLVNYSLDCLRAEVRGESVYRELGQLAIPNAEEDLCRWVEKFNVEPLKREEVMKYKREQINSLRGQAENPYARNPYADNPYANTASSQTKLGESKELAQHRQELKGLEIEVEKLKEKIQELRNSYYDIRDLENIENPETKQKLNSVLLEFDLCKQRRNELSLKIKEEKEQIILLEVKNNYFETILEEPVEEPEGGLMGDIDPGYEYGSAFERLEPREEQVGEKENFSVFWDIAYKPDTTGNPYANSVEKNDDEK